jgi:hypothetical protein
MEMVGQYLQQDAPLPYIHFSKHHLYISSYLKTAGHTVQLLTTQKASQSSTKNEDTKGSGGMTPRILDSDSRWK